MACYQFFVETYGKKNKISSLRPEDARHLVTVLRKKEGCAVTLVDKNNERWNGVIEKIENDVPSVRFTEKTYKNNNDPRRCVTKLYVSLPKGERLKWMLEKCCEAGVDEVTPLITSRSVRRWNKNEYLKHLQKWQKRLKVTACQCKRAYVPEFFPPANIEDVVSSCRNPGIYLHPQSRGTVSMMSFVESKKTSTVSILIGPEGGWTGDELKLLTGTGWTGVHLGTSILRIETAAVLAVGIVNIS